MTASFDIQDTVIAGTLLTLSNLSTDADGFLWYVDGVAAGSTKDLTYSFNDAGIVQVKLVATSGDAYCKPDSMTKKLYVLCPLEACFNYEIKNQYLSFSECGASGNVLDWRIIKDDTKLIFSSAEAADSFYIKPYPFIKLCLTVDNGICTHQHCQYINTTGTHDEICDNGQDDDGDGLIDGFDPDCPCSGTAYYNHCKPECEVIPEVFPDIKMKLKWQSEVLAKEPTPTSSYVVGDITGGNIPEIITFLGTGTKHNVKNYIGVFDGLSGVMLDTFHIFPEYNLYHLILHPAILSNKQDSKKYIYVTSLGEIICIDSEKNAVFRKPLPLNAQNDVVGIADFNNDGIPELYVGASILNAMTGEVLFYDTVSISGNNYYSQVISIASDVLGNDGIPELITGKYVYSVELNNTAGIPGNNITKIQAPPSVGNGKCAVADLDGDGQKEIIVLESNNVNLGKTGQLSVWNPATGELLAQVQNPILPDNSFDGSIPFIGDIDGDCLPEIGVVYNKVLKMYKYNPTIGLTEMYSIKTTDASGTTGVTMFDFNQDGRQELIYRDENFLRIINGESGTTIDSIELLSSTWLEYPLIVDIDNDGQAEIIVSGSLSDKRMPQLFCFESASTPWAPARSVWNQYVYNPTFVNDDLTIPRFQQNTAQPLQHTDQCSREVCSTPYNNFMVQATYRTQEGCYVWPDLNTDLSITASSQCLGDSLRICFYPTASRDGLISQGVRISCFFPWDFGNGPFLIDTLTAYLDTVCIMMPRITGLDSMLIAINDDGDTFTPVFSGIRITECDYTNNTYILDLRSPDLSIDVVDYRCAGDSLAFTIVIENTGKALTGTCVGGCAYYTEPESGTPIDIITWCLDLKPDKITNKSTDTLVVTIPMPVGQTQLFWTVNDAGFGPGFKSAQSSGVFECDYTNNTDSVTIDLSVRELNIGSDTIICQGNIVTIDPGEWVSYEWTDLMTDRINSFGLSGEYWVKTTDQCHRIYADTIQITVIEADSIILPRQEICSGDSLYLYGTWWKESIDTTVNLINQYGCDSIITFELRVIDTIRTNETLHICTGDSISISGQWQKEAGIYTHHYQTVNGCDSIAQVQLVVDQVAIRTDSIAICEGDHVVINGTVYSDEESYQTWLPSAAGCDTLYQFQLTYKPLITKTEEYVICEGDSIFIHDEWVKESKTLTYTITEENCKTEVTATIHINHIAPTINEYTLCPDETITINNTVIDESTELEYILQSVTGCDSLIQVKVTKSSWPPPPAIDLDCEDNVYHAGIEANPDWAILWSNGDTHPQTTLTSSASVTVRNSENCEKVYNIDIDDLPDLNEIPAFDTKRITRGDSIRVNVDLSSDEWQLKWSPSGTVSCDTCFDTNIKVNVNTTITLTLTHSNGCTYIRRFDVIAEKEKLNIAVPNIIHTQSASINNTWTVTIVEGYRILDARVYDRWGNLVYISDNNTISWDGRLKGSYVVPGVYAYYIRLLSPDNKTEILKGDVTVI